MAFRSILTSGAAAPFHPTFSEWPYIPGLSSGGHTIVLDFYLDTYSFFESAGSSVCSSREGAT